MTTDPSQYISGRTVQEQMNELISYVDTRAEEVAEAAVADDVAACTQAVTDARDAKDAAVAAKDTAVSTVSDCVKMTPAAAQTITSYPLTVSQGVNADVTGNITSAGTSAFSGTVTVPTIATGTADTKAANGTKVKNEITANNAYMIMTTGNQTKSGALTMNGSSYTTTVDIRGSNITVGGSTAFGPGLYFSDSQGNTLLRLYIRYGSDGTVQLRYDYRNSGGTMTTNKVLIEGD